MSAARIGAVTYRGVRFDVRIAANSALVEFRPPSLGHWMVLNNLCDDAFVELVECWVARIPTRARLQRARARNLWERLHTLSALQLAIGGEQTYVARNRRWADAIAAKYLGGG